MVSKAGKLYNRAGLWETRAQQAAAKGDLNRSGGLRTKSLQLGAKALGLENGERITIWKKK
jgi:hypothetical protein